MQSEPRSGFQRPVSGNRPIDRLRALAAERGWRVGLRSGDMFGGVVLRVVGRDGRELALSSCSGRDRGRVVDLAAEGLLEAVS